MEGARLTADMRSVTESSSSQAALCSPDTDYCDANQTQAAPPPAPATNSRFKMLIESLVLSKIK